MPAVGPVIETYLRALDPEVRRSTDGQLLDRFRKARDGDAFAELVRRHGPLVLGVCRRALGDSADAEDAFQLTFLALARRPGAVRRRDTAAPWLYRVALRTARKAAARRTRTPEPPAQITVEPAELTAAELWAGLDEELRRLPERLRAPLVLCYLDGRSRDDAARLLGWSVGTLKRRLEAGRRVLRARLIRRGLAPAGLAAAVAGPGLRAAVPPGLADRVALAAMTAGRATGRAVFAVPLILALGASTVLVGAFGGGDKKNLPTAPPPRVVEARVDRFGDPLPDGAVQRLGTARHRAAGASVAVTADGKTVVTAGDDLVVRTFDAKTGDTLSTRVLDTAEARYATLSADGRYLAAAVYPAPRMTYELRVWDLTSGKEAARLDLKGNPVSAVAVHSPTKRLAFIRGVESSPPSEQTACVWDFGASGKPVDLRTFRRPDNSKYGEPRSLFSRDGTQLLVHQTDGQLVCWDVAAAKALWEKPLRYMKFFFFHPDGRHVVVSTKNVGGTGFEVWTVSEGAEVSGAGRDGGGPKAWSQGNWPVAMSADGRVVACFSGQRRVALYDTAKKAIVRELDDPLWQPGEGVVGFWAVPTNFAFTPDGTGFVWRSPTVQRWDVATGKPTWPATWDRGHTEAVARLLYSPDGSALVSAAKDGTFYVWYLATGRPRHRLPTGYGDLAALSPDGRALVTGGRTTDRNTPLTEWDLGTGTPLRAYKTDVDYSQYGSSFGEAAVTADGTRVVTLTDNHTAQVRIPRGRYLTVWDRATGKLVREETVAELEETTALAPGGQTFARFSVNSSHLGVRLVSVETGKELRRLDDDDLPPPRTYDVGCQIVYSSDGRSLVTRLESTPWAERPIGDKPVKVWDPATGREVARFPAAGPARFAFAPDNRSLVIAGPAGFRVFELATRREALAVMAAPTPGQRGRAFADAVAVGPGGRTVATGHADGTILIWDATGPRTRLDAAAAWAALADSDPRVGWPAVWRLADSPDSAVRLIGEKLKPAAADPTATGLVGRLDAGEFRVREEAERALRALGSRAEPALRAALAGKPSAELRTRAERLLTLLTEGPVAGDDLRAIRAVQVLEAVGTPEARRLLEGLAGGDRHARLTREAQAALARASAW